MRSIKFKSINSHVFLVYKALNDDDERQPEEEVPFWNEVKRSSTPQQMIEINMTNELG